MHFFAWVSEATLAKCIVVGGEGKKIDQNRIYVMQRKRLIILSMLRHNPNSNLLTCWHYVISHIKLRTSLFLYASRKCIPYKIYWNNNNNNNNNNNTFTGHHGASKCNISSKGKGAKRVKYICSLYFKKAEP